jgi:hypothetical protein
MSDRITILNQRAGKVILPPDPEELKKNPKAKERILQSGESISVSADEAPKLLRHKMLVDAATVLQGAESPEVKRLKAELEAEKSKNSRLEEAAAKRGAGAADDEAAKAEKAAAKEADKAAAALRKSIMKKGARVLMQDGGLGSVVKVHPHKKGAADDEVDVKLDINGNVSPFLVSTLKLAPEA